MTRPATLHDLAHGAVRHQVEGVLAWCNRCHHNQVLPLAALLPRLGPDCQVPQIGRRLVCSSCGSRNIDTRPAWRHRVEFEYPDYAEARRDLEPVGPPSEASPADGNKRL